MTSQRKQKRRANRPRYWLLYLIVWAAVASTFTSCIPYRRIEIEVPVSAKLDVSRFDRVLVAGFVTQTTESLDLDIETVRLLRSQLRNHSSLMVLDAATPFLGDFSEKTLEQNGKIEEFGRFRQALQEEDGKRFSLEEWIAFEMEKVLLDEEYWRMLGEEYQKPLIVSGSLKLISEPRSMPMPSRPRDVDPFDRPPLPGGAPVIEGMQFALTVEFYFIDGSTGKTIHRERLTEEVIYGRDEQISSLASYFELMDRLLPNFLSVLTNRTLRHSRFLLT